MNRLHRLLAVLLMLLSSPMAMAFDLADLQKQLSAPAVVSGNFVQEKHLRALAQPLTSQGRFVLARDHGLLWLLRTPLRQDYRIDASGIARRDPGGWQPLPSQSAGAQQNRLFFAVLQGDSSGLQRDFELSLSGDAEHWQLRLTPRSMLLKQIFTRIDITGGRFVERIVLAETQGDSTVLRMQDSRGASALSDSERRDFAD
ncbi:MULTISPECIES: outer membrane lipoprotein carrier protein LolA [Pseudomonas]|uniref:Outer membrane lipoprotein carrier protein LolA n=2 Tax=Pseudomonas TaxID=286 RepID=A0AAX0W079_9PSED|nr:MULTISPECIES: outer membrane lipoprotein carrier protein LolA [Pseudomonas]MBH3357449.1 outer membrane lipoprotein carrier protein LolA [Pseudomonas guariconensis]MCO7622980.1 outer membrane lipoprotein carrier protein LolA [Pseudomonas guariconensis]MDM9592061.1 outer membrane lipoprotein carrier protein LolA [Pseudomonas guariconensis]MDM9604888.1 outer membrane lipoprotein carrier protein LolA [Pseudomonas guariconensis]MDM9609845.1 outer membrane lipoprotein carrier protein LolA [Pseudo